MYLFNKVIQVLQNKIDSENIYKKDIIRCIEENIHINITLDQIISLKEGILTINTNPIIKMEIFLKKELLINKLKEKSIIISNIK